MICSVCGAYLRPDARFCSSCGTAVEIPDTPLQDRLVAVAPTLTTLWRGRVLLILWIVAMLVTGLGYQFGLRADLAALLIWGVPTILALVVSCLFINWRVPGERYAQLYWLIAVPVLSIITILAFNVPAMGGFLDIGLAVWSVFLSLGYVFTGRAVGWGLMVRAGILSLVFVFFYRIPELEPFTYGFFAISHASVMGLLASS